MKFDYKVQHFYKYADETFSVEYDFTNDLGSSETISSSTVTVIGTDGTDYTSTMISTTTTSSPDVLFTITGGTGGQVYEITVSAVTDASNTYTRKLICEVYETFNLNTKVADPAANSYVTLTEAIDYIKSKYGHGNTWDVLDLNGKKRVLVQAAREIDMFNYQGDKYYTSQNLEFPRDDHEIVTGDVATPITNTSFRNTGLYSTTYGKMPTNYWKYGSVHITAGTPVYDIREISQSNVTNGSITLASPLSATPTTNTDFIVFAPVPDDIKNAQCEQALFISQNESLDNLMSYKNLGAADIRIGDVYVKFSDSTGARVVMSSVAKKLLTRYIDKHIRIGRT